MPSSNSFLSVASGHTDALIDYVLDVKPYHTKLLQIVEEYLFNDDLNVQLTEKTNIVAFLGADIVDPDTFTGANRKFSTSWLKTFISDAARTVFKIPSIAAPKFASHFSLEDFTCGIDDDQQIYGLTLGAFNQRRWEGPGITRVSKNGEYLQEGVNFYISHGVFSFENTGVIWKRKDILDSTASTHFVSDNGALRYEILQTPHGTIDNIVVNSSVSAYEEWTLTCTYIDATTATLQVVGSTSGYVGDASFNIPFVHPNIGFTFSATHGDPPTAVPVIDIGYKFVLTPKGKITIHENALDEVWSIIKVNPICISSPVFTAGEPIPVGTATPGIQIYNRDLHKTISSSWTIEFLSSSQYTITAIDNSFATLPGYPKTIDLLDGCSYKDENIHFSLIPVQRGFKAGDTFNFDVFEEKPIMKVYGSLSGWQQDAELDKWYWNGSIGFKFESLELVALEAVSTTINSTTFNTWKPTSKAQQVEFYIIPGGGINGENIQERIHPMAEPSVYEITFVKEDANFKYARITNNILGKRKGLRIDKSAMAPTEWNDEFIRFKLHDDVDPFNVGDVIRIYAGTRSRLLDFGGYDEFDYDTTPYDIAVNESFRHIHLMDYPPFYHSHGTVIVNDCIPNDKIIIDKAYFDAISLRLPDFNTATAPELDQNTDSWVSLIFTHGDRLDSSGEISSIAEFSDLSTRIDAYLAIDPSYKVFSLTQPKYKCTNRSESCVLEFSDDFLEDYLQRGNKFTIRVHPQELYSEKIRVKIVDKLVISALVKLNIDEIINITISESIISNIIIGDLNIDEIMLVTIDEGGIIPYYKGYDEPDYETAPYDTPVFEAYRYSHLDEFPPFTILNGAPGVLLQTEESPEMAQPSFQEGLTIVETNTVTSATTIHGTYISNNLSGPNLSNPNDISGLLVFSQEADEYIVTHDYTGGTPTVIIYPQVGTPFQVIPDTHTNEQSPTSISEKSFKFTVPVGTAPFGVWLV